MYEKFFCLQENPFSMSPDPKFFFPSQRHVEALDTLIYTITQKRGFAVITGEIGSGKTTVCRTLLNRLGSSTKVVMITHTPSTSKELLSYILENLGIAFNGRTAPNLLSRLKKFLIEQSSLDFNVVLIIDEAQNLSCKKLEEVRMLSNLETENKKMMQIILTGQPELKDKLELKELAPLRQRICVHYHILPLSKIDTEKYIQHRLRVVSINANTQIEFTKEAIDEVYDYSQGIPRMINKICNNALLIGYVIETRQITAQLIKEAIEEEFQMSDPIRDNTLTGIDGPVIKLKSKPPKANAVVLTAYKSNGEIKIKQMDNDLFNLVYNGIRISYRNQDAGHYGNITFFAKGYAKKDYPTVFRMELTNGTGKVGKYYPVGITDSWQKFSIPLKEFSRIIDLDIVTEITLYMDNVIDTDGVTYIKGICFSNK